LRFFPLFDNLVVHKAYYYSILPSSNIHSTQFVALLLIFSANSNINALPQRRKLNVMVWVQTHQQTRLLLWHGLQQLALNSISRCGKSDTYDSLSFYSMNYKVNKLRSVERFLDSERSIYSTESWKWRFLLCLIGAQNVDCRVRVDNRIAVRLIRGFYDTSREPMIELWELNKRESN
jgi:hypothetical protein